MSQPAETFVMKFLSSIYSSRYSTQTTSEPDLVFRPILYTVMSPHDFALSTLKHVPGPLEFLSDVCLSDVCLTSVCRVHRT